MSKKRKFDENKNDCSNCNKLNNIINQKNYKINELVLEFKNINNIINLLKDKLSSIDRQINYIINPCDHKWQIDTSFACEKTMYACILCGETH